MASNTSRACKIVDKLEIDHLGGDTGSGGSFQKNTMMTQFLTEIDTLRSLHHPNIIELYDVFISPDKIYIIMELMEGGELFDYVVQKGTLTEEEASRIVRKVTSALVYMHSKNVIHRDMKPENLLLAHKPRSSHDIEVKIIDFGLSKVRRKKRSARLMLYIVMMASNDHLFIFSPWWADIDGHTHCLILPWYAWLSCPRNDPTI